MRHQRNSVAVLALVIAAVGAWFGHAREALAHAGSSDPNAIHACQNTYGGIRIVGVSGTCTSTETALHWAIQGSAVNTTTVFGTASLTPTTGTFTLVPGLTQTVNVPANGVVYISTDGGILVNSATANAFSVVDVALFVDGTFTHDGAFRRLQATNVQGLGGLTNWSMALSLLLSPGTHTILVAASLNPGSSASATVSGNNTSVLQGELTIMIISP